MPRVLTLCLAATVISACGGGEAPPPLPRMQLDPARVAVAGISSGASMAQQVHLAFSDRITGAALLAGSPYGCAENSLRTALSRCIEAQSDAPAVTVLAARARMLAEQGKIAPLSGLDGDTVLVLRGTRDALVAAPVVRASLDIYRALERESRSPWTAGMRLELQEGDYAHLWPTLTAGGACDCTEAPYIGACNLDLAGTIMRTLFDIRGDMVADVDPIARGALLRFDQRALLSDDDAYLDDAGFLYRPPQCVSDTRCGLLIAFHGCEQNVGAVGDLFARDSGFNRWADVADVVVLYPQTRATYMPLNPKGCWDWWGYSGADYATRDGVQLRWLANLGEALGVPLLP